MNPEQLSRKRTWDAINNERIAKAYDQVKRHHMRADSDDETPVQSATVFAFEVAMKHNMVVPSTVYQMPARDEMGLISHSSPGMFNNVALPLSRIRFTGVPWAMESLWDRVCALGVMATFTYEFERFDSGIGRSSGHVLINIVECGHDESVQCCCNINAEMSIHSTGFPVYRVRQYLVMLMPVSFMQLYREKVMKMLRGKVGGDIASIIADCMVSMSGHESEFTHILGNWNPELAIIPETESEGEITTEDDGYFVSDSGSDDMETTCSDEFTLFEE